MLPSLSLPPLECCLGTRPIQAEKLRPDRKTFGSPTVATTAVASTGPTPGASSILILISLDRCQAMISRSNSSICSLNPQLSSKCYETHAGYRRNPIVSWIGDGMEQFLDTFAADR